MRLAGSSLTALAESTLVSEHCMFLDLIRPFTVGYIVRVIKLQDRQVKIVQREQTCTNKIT